jgi:hypothetical protein
MLNISQLRLALAEDGVQATSIARAELTTRVAEYKELGEDARAIVFGSHRKPQAVIVPIEMFNQLLDLAEGIATTPKAAPIKQKVRAANSSVVSQLASESVPELTSELTTEPRQLAGSELHIGASTQELLDEIMKKWKI